MDRRKFLRNAGWSLVGLAASGNLFAADKWNGKDVKKILPSASNLKMYWGDLHNHCNLTYGHGDMRTAFEAAKGQLDFVSVTPHAMWPDIPGANDPRLNWVIDYHTGAFKKLREGGWQKYVAMTNEYNKEGEFLTFLGYECHSMEHGDHVALNYDLDAPLVECTSVTDLKQKLKGKKVFVTPHHMGYQEGYRGYNWKHFSEGEQTPFVEMFSRHGLAESDMGDYNYLHDMGPRQWEGTIQYGLSQGKKFGIMGSTDQHAGYPGSYGDGRIGVLASSLKRGEIWDALKNRHVCCATGDKINIDFRLNDAFMGDVVKGKSRRIYVNVEGASCIDYVDIVKNGRCIARMSGPQTPVMPKEENVHCKVKVNFGWNREQAVVSWNGKLSLNKGKLNSVTPCFRGAAFTSPQESDLKKGHVFETKVNKILSSNEKETELEIYTSMNPNTTTPAMQGVILDVTMPKDGVIAAEFNGKMFKHSLGELLEGTRAHFMRGWLSEAIQFERAMPDSCYRIEHFMEDTEQEKDTDYYYVRVRQRDQQWAWSSPIWVERG
ncbi:Tat pathway signal sequence [Bacteroides sedimenti]